MTRYVSECGGLTPIRSSCLGSDVILPQKFVNILSPRPMTRGRWYPMSCPGSNKN